MKSLDYLDDTMIWRWSPPTSPFAPQPLLPMTHSPQKISPPPPTQSLRVSRPRKPPRRSCSMLVQSVNNSRIPTSREVPYTRSSRHNDRLFNHNPYHSTLIDQNRQVFNGGRQPERHKSFTTAHGYQDNRLGNNYKYLSENQTDVFDKYRCNVSSNHIHQNLTENHKYNSRSQRNINQSLVTVHINNLSCASSGSEAFFNLKEHAGQRGLARSTSCVSNLNKFNYDYTNHTGNFASRNNKRNVGNALQRNSSVAMPKPPPLPPRIYRSSTFAAADKSYKIIDESSEDADENIIRRAALLHQLQEDLKSRRYDYMSRREKLDEPFRTPHFVPLDRKSASSFPVKPNTARKWQCTGICGCGCTSTNLGDDTCSLTSAFVNLYKFIVKTAVSCKYIYFTVLNNCFLF